MPCDGTLVLETVQAELFERRKSLVTVVELLFGLRSYAEIGFSNGHGVVNEKVVCGMVICKSEWLLRADLVISTSVQMEKTRLTQKMLVNNH